MATSSFLDGMGRAGAAVVVVVQQPAERVLIPVATAVFGYSAKAIERKIATGVWVEGQQWSYAPDGRVVIIRKGVEAWMERGGKSARKKRPQSKPG